MQSIDNPKRDLRAALSKLNAFWEICSRMHALTIDEHLEGNMSQETPHKLGEFGVRFDELTPPDTVVMRKATYEKISGELVIDATLPVRGEPGSIERAGRPLTLESTTTELPVAKTEEIAPPVLHETAPEESHEQ